MNTDTLNINKQEENTNYIVHPKKFLVWLFIASIVMLFGAMTSAYIVRKGEGNWLAFDLPQAFNYSTVLIILSSISYHFSYLAAKVDNLKNVKIGLIATLILGVGFLYAQYYSWVELVSYKGMNGFGIVFGGKYSNPSGSFLYVISGLHGFHIITGLAFVLSVLILAIKGKVGSQAMLWVESCSTYWHFLGGLWIYLYIFLLLNH